MIKRKVWASRWRLTARSLKWGLILSVCGGLLACTPHGVDPGNLGGTAQALAQTAQAGGAQAGTALAGVPGTASVLQATLAAKATQFAPTGVALASQAVAAAATAATAIAQITPPSTADPALASAAVSTYAQQILGIAVTIVQAGGLTGSIQNLIQLPKAGDAAAGSAASVAARTYGAILNNGAASVSYGSGKLSGDLKVEINAASLGAFSLDAGAGSGNAAEALQVGLQTFPALASQSFIRYPVTQGYAWFAHGQVPGNDRTTKQPTLVAQAVLLSVTSTLPGRSLVSVVVGKGSFASNLIP